MKRLLGFIFLLAMTASAFAIRIGEYTLKFDEKLANKVWRKEVLLHLDSIKIHGELSQENFMTLRYMAMLGDVKGIDLSDCVIEGDSIMDWAFKSDFINGAPRRESESIDDYDKSEPSYGYRANFRCFRLPRGLKHIAEQAFFWSCLTYMEIPSSVTRIDMQPFMDCTFLKAIKVAYKSLDGLDIDRYAFDGIPENVTLLVPKGTKAMYEADERFSYFTAIEEYDEDTNGISTVAPAISKTQADKFYTLDGGYAGTDFSSLPKGTYVVGGKKVMK